MDAQKRQKIIYVLFIAAIIWGAYNFMGDKKAPVGDAPKPISKTSTIYPDEQSIDIDIEKYSSLEWGNDPFYRGIKREFVPATENKSPLWNLGGILYGSQRPSAIINKRVVRDGDIIDGARVVQIDKETVTLDKEGLLFTLTIAKDKS